MEKQKRQLIVGIVGFSILIIMESTLAVGSPHMFVRIINVIVVIAISMTVGVFIRELFILNSKKNTKSVDGD